MDYKLLSEWRDDIMNTIDFLLGRVVSFMANVSRVGIILLMALIVIDVILRHTVSSAIPGGIGFSSLIMAITIYFAIAKGQETKEHLSVNILIDRFIPSGTKARQYWDVVTYLVAIIFFGIIMYASIEAFMTSFEIKEHYSGASLRVPIYPARGAILIGCVMMVCQLIYDVIHLFRPQKQDGL